MSQATTPETVEQQPAKGVWARFVQFEQRLGGWIDGWNPYHPENLEGKGLKPVAIEESDIRRNAAKWFLGFFALTYAKGTTSRHKPNVQTIENKDVAGMIVKP